jgi:hypothetical protein
MIVISASSFGGQKASVTERFTDPRLNFNSARRHQYYRPLRHTLKIHTG